MNKTETAQYILSAPGVTFRVISYLWQFILTVSRVI